MKDKMPNDGKYGKGKMGKSGASNNGSCSGLKKENPQRADVTKSPSSKNPFPRGLA